MLFSLLLKGINIFPSVGIDYASPSIFPHYSGKITLFFTLAISESSQNVIEIYHKFTYK